MIGSRSNIHFSQHTRIRMSQNPQWDDGASGSRYLGSFIGEATERDSWIATKVDDWVYSIKKLAGASRSAYPQSAYSALQRSVQQEWQYLQRTAPNMESCFHLDAPSNIQQKPEAVLLSHKREKKKKYLQACLDQRRHFSPFVVSWDVLLGN